MHSTYLRGDSQGLPIPGRWSLGRRPLVAAGMGSCIFLLPASCFVHSEPTLSLRRFPGRE